MKILFASTYCLLDTASGAAISMRSLLELLASRHCSCEAVTASVFDPVREVSLQSVFKSHGLLTGYPEFPGCPELAGRKVFEVSKEGVKHTLLETASSRRKTFSAGEESSLLFLVECKIRELHPDILLTYGGFSTEMEIHKLAQRYGIRVVFYLANGLYRNSATFANIDLFLVPSRFLSDHYKKRLGIDSHVLYPIIGKDRCVLDEISTPASLQRRFITFVNPAPHKGLGLFYRITSEAVRLVPHAEFLVVEGYWTKDDVSRAGIDLASLPNVSFVANQPDVRPIYARTGILLVPSYWDEGMSRTVLEAQMNGIPVVASRRGGIPEALNGGGILLDISARCKRNYAMVPSAGEAGPWIHSLRVLLENREVYEEMQTRALQAAAGFSTERSLEAAAKLFSKEPLERTVDSG